MPEKGPPVFLDYDQAELDAAYDQAAYVPNREQLIKRRVSDSELARLRVGEPECVSYGPAEIERLDIYRTERDAALYIGGQSSGGHLAAVAVLDNAPVAVLLAILPANLAAQEHDGRQLSAHWRS